MLDERGLVEVRVASNFYIAGNFTSSGTDQLDGRGTLGLCGALEASSEISGQSDWDDWKYGLQSVPSAPLFGTAATLCVDDPTPPPRTVCAGARLTDTPTI